MMTIATRRAKYDSIARLAVAVRFFRALGATEMRAVELASWAGISAKVARRICRENRAELEVLANVERATGRVLDNAHVEDVSTPRVFRAISFEDAAA